MYCKHSFLEKQNNIIPRQTRLRNQQYKVWHDFAHNNLLIIRSNIPKIKGMVAQIFLCYSLVHSLNIVIINVNEPDKNTNYQQFSLSHTDSKSHIQYMFH